MTTLMKVSGLFRQAVRIASPLLLAVLVGTCDQTTILVVDVSQVSINGSTSVSTGSTVQLSATPRGPNGRTLTGRTVTWGTQNSAVASVDSNGTVTGVFTGQATITATIDGIQGTTTVTVSGSITTTSLDVADLNQPYSQALTAKGGTGSYTWSVVSGSLPQGLSLSSSGVISGTPTRLGHSVFTIEVTSGGASETKNLYIDVEGSVALGGGSVTLEIPAGALSDEVDFTASSTTSVPTSDLFVDGSAYDIGPDGTTFAVPVTLELAYNPLAIPDEVEESELRLYKVVDGEWVLMNNGSVNPVTHKVSGEVTSLSRYGARGLAVGSIDVSPSSPTLEQWSTVQLSATPRAVDGTVLGSRPVHYTSGDETVVTVDRNGLVTAEGAGTAVVEVMSGGIRVYVNVTVSEPTVSTVVVDPAAASLIPSGTIQLTATARHSSGNVIAGKTATWQTSNGSVASVSSSGVVTAGDIGTATITATIDGVDGTAVITVADNPVATVTVTPATSALIPGGTRQLTATARDGEGNVLVGRDMAWSSDATGVASVDQTGFVTAQGVGTATITATSEGKSGTATVYVYGPLSITTSTLVGGTVGSLYVESISATGGDGNYTWSIESGSLPQGLSLGAQSGGITGSPTSTGTSVFTVKVQSGDGQTATKELSITITLPPPTITTTSLPGGVVGSAYSQTLTVTGGDGSYTWAVTAGTLPAGLNLTGSTGVISGTPTAAGTSAFTVQVTSNGQTATKQLSITISTGLTVTTTSLPDGVVGTAYNATLAAQAGNGTYTWAITAGTLPAGLTLTGSTGVISGTPTTAGISTFTVQVTSNGQTATKQLSITVESGGTYNCLSQSQIPEAECQALVALYTSTNGSGWTNSTGWLATTTPCSWYGVTCSGGSVLNLNLISNQLSGSIPTQIGDLTNLQVLTLSEAQITGTIPTQIGNLTSLVRFSLAANQLSGSIPPELGGLTSLEQLDLSANQLTGSIPTGLGNLSNLTSLHLYANQLSGSIPSELQNLTNLQRLGLDDNQLTGSIPSWLGNLSSLWLLNLHGNQLTGTIPAELGSLTSLTQFWLDGNQLSGVIPLAVAQLGGGIQTPGATGNQCVFTPGNTGLYMPDNTDYRAADLDSDGLICGVGFTSSTLGVGFGDEQFALIPAGTFQMGSTNGNADEQPVHSVNITYSFYMQKTEVTQGQWQAVMGSLPSGLDGCGDFCPVAGVSWADIQGFLSALQSQDPGKNYRLPTEAEWEYAARAGTAGDYGGTGVLDEMGWYIDNSSHQRHPVAQKLANGWGLYDMHGNAWEWVNDWYLSDYFLVSPSEDPQGPVSGTYRVLRGGSWEAIASSNRSAARGSSTPTNQHFDYGFRLVKAGPGASSVAVATTSLTDGTVGTAYSKTLSASGGSGTYRWTIDAGSLPDGLSLNGTTGVLSGTPTTIGTSNFTVRVFSGGVTSTRDLSLTVRAAHNWEQVTLPAGTQAIWALWGTGPNDIFASCNGGVIHYDGVSWSAQSIPSPQGELKSIWGFSSNDVWTISGNSLLHYDGTSWTVEAQIPEGNFTAIWGPSSNEIYAGGWSNVMARYDGTTWTQEMAPEDVNAIFSIHGTSSGTAIAGGQRTPASNPPSQGDPMGAILNRAGGTWVEDLDHSWIGAGPQSLWVLNDNLAYGAGSDFGVFDGTTWTRDVSFPGGFIVEASQAVWARSATEVYVVGQTCVSNDCDPAVFFFDGTIFEDVTPPGIPDTGPIAGVWGTPDGSAVYFVGGTAPDAFNMTEGYMYRLIRG